MVYGAMRSKSKSMQHRGATSCDDIPLESQMILWSSVSSTTIKQIGYEPSVKYVHIRFKTGDKPLTYFDVPEEVYRDFLSAQSKSTYYKKNIDGKFAC